MSPLCTLVLAFFILRERIYCFDLSMISMTVAGVLLVVYYGNPTTPNGEKSDQTQMESLILYIEYFALFTVPLLSAGGNIAMRRMQNFHDAVVSWYLSMCMAIVCLAAITVTGSGLQPILQFDAVSWLLSMGTGLFGMSAQTLKFIALKLEKASKLQKLQPLTTVFTFVFDILLF